MSNDAHRKTRHRVTETQLNCLLEFIEINRNLIYGTLAADFRSVDRDNKWKEISKKLNGMGPTKTAVQWRKTWNDQKSHVRSKLAQLKVKEIKKDKSAKISFSTSEKKILKMLSWKSFLKDGSKNNSKENIVDEISNILHENENSPVENENSPAENENSPVILLNTQYSIKASPSEDSLSNSSLPITEKTSDENATSDANSTESSTSSSNKNISPITSVPVQNVSSVTSTSPSNKNISLASSVPVQNVSSVASASTPSASRIQNIAYIPTVSSSQNATLIPGVSSVPKLISVPDLLSYQKIIPVPEVASSSKIYSVPELYSVTSQPYIYKIEKYKSIEEALISQSQPNLSKSMDFGTEDVVIHIAKQKEKQEKLDDKTDILESFKKLIETQNRALLLIAQSSQRQVNEASKQTKLLSKLVKELKSLSKNDT